jgi:3-methylcrotonyl-CoA carboxylase alpha subunit
VDDAAAFAAGLAAARREAAGAFGDDRVLLERYLAAPKHLEVQVLADSHGRTLHLFERDCSVQRRHQKVIEEAPGPTVTPELRQALGEAAVKAARAVEYRGAGTVEFIAEGDRFYFMEMNTRLQVEHPVTEAVTGLDLVEWQLRVAAGEALPFSQQEISCRGHAVEARLYAEIPRRGFLPATGSLLRVRFPGNVRVDSGVAEGDAVTVHYDPMLAKVIAHGDDRSAAVTALDAALAATELAGVEHNVAFLRAVLAEEDFRTGRYTTHLIDEAGGTLLEAAAADGATGPEAAVAAALALRQAATGNSLWGSADGFRLNLPSAFTAELEQDERVYRLRVGADFACFDDQHHELEVLSTNAHEMIFRLDDRVVRAGTLVADDTVYVMRRGDTGRFRRPRLSVDALAHGGAERVTSPMPGQVISVAVQPGDTVRAGDLLVVVEAMKMEHNVTAPRDGVVATVACAEGDRVEDGVELVTLEES